MAESFPGKKSSCCEGCIKGMKMFFADCNWGTALTCMLLNLSQPFWWLIMGTCHQQMIDMLKWVSDLTEAHTIVGITVIFSITLACTIAMVPYSVNELILGYSLMNKFGLAGGCVMMLILDPIMFASASLVPFFFSRLLCKDCITSNLVDKMRFFKALAPLLEMQGTKMTALVRMAGGVAKPSQNYILAATKLKYKPFWLGSILGTIP